MDAQTKYSIVLEGKLVPGFSHEKARTLLMEKLKIPEQSVDKILSTTGVAVKNKITFEQAKRLAYALRTCGVECQYVEEARVEIKSGAILSPALYVAVWLSFKQTPKARVDFQAIAVEWLQKIREHESIICVQDKELILEQLLPHIEELSATRAIDGQFFKTFTMFSENWSPEDFNSVVGLVCFIFTSDKQLSKIKLECLTQLSVHCKKEKTFFEDKCRELLPQEDKKLLSDSSKSINAPKKVSFTRKFAVISGLVGFFALGLLGWGGYEFLLQASAVDKTDILSRLHQQNKLVIKQIDFSKFLIAGKPADTVGLLDELNVFLVKGTADIEFSLEKLTVDKDATDVLTRKLVLRIHSTLPTVKVRVNLKETYLVSKIDPERMSEDVAIRFAKGAGVVGGIGGAVVGSHVGGAVGAGGGTIMRMAGSALGATTGAVAGGAGAYIMTKNFLTNKEFAINSLGDKEKVVNAGENLIKLELMGGDFLDSETWEEDMVAYYKEEFAKSLMILLGPLGWQKIELVEAGS